MNSIIDKFILGTVQFGLKYGINNNIGKPNENDVYSMLEYANENGIKILDTADVYGNAIELIGNYIKRNPASFKINTKFKKAFKSISEQLEISLEILQIEQVGTYFFHSINDFFDEPKMLEALANEKKAGRIEKIGVSVYSNEELLKVIEYPDFDVIQFPFNLFDNMFQRGEAMKLAKMKNKELQVRSVFLQGLFFKKIETLPSNLLPLGKYIEKIDSLAKKYKVSIEEMAIGYALHQIEINGLILGVDTLTQLERNISYFKNTKLESTLFDEISEIKVSETNLLSPVNWY